jgi:hypothetical protein
MVYDDDTTPRRFRRIPPNSDVPSNRRHRRSSGPTPEPSDEIKLHTITLAQQNPVWDARRIQAEIRAETNRYDVTVEMISEVLTEYRTRRR